MNICTKYRSETSLRFVISTPANVPSRAVSQEGDQSSVVSTWISQGAHLRERKKKKKKGRHGNICRLVWDLHMICIVLDKLKSGLRKCSH